MLLVAHRSNGLCLYAYVSICLSAYVCLCSECLSAYMSMPNPVKQVDAVGVVFCCWLHMARVAILRFAQESPVLQAIAKADEQANSQKCSL